MKIISSLEQLDVPYYYRGFLSHFLSNVSKIEEVSRVILFGSCARGQVGERSDIDLLVITDKEIPLDVEFYIMNDCPPAYNDEFYVPADIIVDPTNNYDRLKNSFGMVQKAVEREGVDLSELLR